MFLHAVSTSKYYWRNNFYDFYLMSYFKPQKKIEIINGYVKMHFNMIANNQKKKFENFDYNKSKNN